jgi:spore coat protein U-like protein
MRNQFIRSVLPAAALLALSGAAFAGTETSDLPVSATVAASCTIDASGGLAFGAYDPIVVNKTTDLDAQGTILTTCTNGSTVTVTLGQGVNADGASTDAAPVRRMVGASSNFLAYQLYTDNGRGTVWDNTTGSDVVGTGTAVSTPVYGRIVAGQNVAADSYNDTVVATITF